MLEKPVDINMMLNICQKLITIFVIIIIMWHCDKIYKYYLIPNELYDYTHPYEWLNNNMMMIIMNIVILILSNTVLRTLHTLHTLLHLIS